MVKQQRWVLKTLTHNTFRHRTFYIAWHSCRMFYAGSLDLLTDKPKNTASYNWKLDTKLSHVGGGALSEQLGNVQAARYSVSEMNPASWYHQSALETSKEN